MNLQQFKAELKTTLDSYDKWGSAMIPYFECANHLYYKDSSKIPEHWQYSPGISDDPREEDDYFFELFDGCSIGELITIGNFLSRYTDLLDKNGHSY